MPTYQVFCSRELLNDNRRQALAQAITDGHTAQTGAPAYYVQVIFQETENRYIGGRPRPESLWLRGDVRGRSPEQNRALMAELTRRVSQTCPALDPDMIWIDLCAIESTDIWKFRSVLPPAGREGEWLESLPEETREKIRRLFRET